MRGFDTKQFFCLDDYYDMDRPAYYRVLQAVNQNTLDITKWLEYFVAGVKVSIVAVKERIVRLSSERLRKVKKGQISLTEKQMKIVEFINRNGRITNRDIRNMCVGLDGKPLMPSYKKDKWIDHNRMRFDALLASIEREGGVDTMQWVRAGQPLGYLKEQNEFVGNIYIEVTIGKEAKKMVLEIEATQEAQTRSRLLTPDSGVLLKTWEYYQADVL